MHLIIDALPSEIQKLHHELDSAIAAHRDLQRKAAEAAAAEPIATRALDDARTALGDAEVSLALATDEDEKALIKAFEGARRRFQEAEEGARRVQLLSRGLAARIERAADALITAKAPFEAACRPFCDDVLARYRDLLRGSLFGANGLSDLPFVRVLRLGYALADALPFKGMLNSVLEQISVPDIGPVAGRPVPRFVQGLRVWLDDDQIAASSLREWDGDPEIAALHALLKPLGATHAGAVTRILRIQQDRQIAQSREPPKPRVELQPPPRQISAEEFMASQPTAEEHRAYMREEQRKRADAFGAKPPVERTYHNGGARFANSDLA